MKIPISNKSVSNKFLFWVALPLLPLMIIMGSLLGSYVQSVQQKHENEHNIYTQQQLSTIIAEPLYFFEYRTINTIVNTAIKSSSINYVSILDEMGNTIIEAGQPAAIITKVNVSYQNENKSKYVGELQISYTPEAPEQWILGTFSVPIILSLLSFFFLSILLYSSWHFVIAKPLDQLHQGMINRVDRHELPTPIVMDRQDEFGEIAMTFNNLLVNLKRNKRTIGQVNQRLQHLANYDQLTGLLNQHSFQAEVNAALAEKNGQHYCFIFIDLDKFKWINDSYGHPLGDAILKHVSACLREAMPDGIISRFGGDEFVALHPVSESGDKALFDKICHHVKRRVKIQNIMVQTTVSIGAAYFPDDAEDYKSLLSKADAAMYHAKTIGRDTVCIFDHLLHSKLGFHQKITELLQSPDIGHCLEIFFQPIIDIRHHKVSGAEVLLRLKDKQYADISIPILLQIAEEYGHITRVDQWVRSSAFSCIKNWQNEGLEFNHLHINLSAINLGNPLLAQEIIDQMNTYQVAPSDIVLEITESALIPHFENAKLQLDKLNEFGIKIALDDFGVGYSSLSMLTSFPIQTLKMDQSFFASGQLTNQQQVVKHVVNMAHDLKMDIIAEGVQSSLMASYLQNIGCYSFQGFKYYRPMNQQAFRRLLADPDKILSSLQKQEMLAEDYLATEVTKAPCRPQ